MIQIVRDLKIDDLRGLVAEVMSVPLDNVLEWGVQQDVSALPFFCTVRKNPSSQLSTHKKFDRVNEVQTIESQKSTVVIVGFHGKNAVTMAEFFELALISEKANHLFDNINAGLVNTSDIQNLTIPLAGGYEERAEIQLTLSHNFIIKYEQNKIDSVNIGLVLNQ